MKELIQKAIEIAGGRNALARACGKAPPHVNSWLKQRRVTADTAVLIDAATKGQVSKSALRPDLWPPGE